MKWTIISFSFYFFSNCTLSPETFKEGKELYETHCSNCHGLKFEGLVKLYPALSGEKIRDYSRSEMVCLIIKGRKTKSEDNFKSEMPPFDKLSEIQICNILNYLGNHFGANTNYFPSEIQDIRLKCSDQK